MTEVTTAELTESAEPDDAAVAVSETATERAVTSVAADEQLVAELAQRARADGVSLAGEDGLLKRLTKVVVEAALEGEMGDHLGYVKHDSGGRDGGNSRNGTRAKTVLSDVGPVQVDVPRDRDATFEPTTVRKRQQRLNGVDHIVLSLSAKGLTSGEVSAHLGEVYGASVSKATITAITDRVLEKMAEWQSRPLDRGRLLPIVANPDRKESQCHDGRGTRRRRRPSVVTSSSSAKVPAALPHPSK